LSILALCFGKTQGFGFPIPLHFMDNFNTYQTLKEHVRFTFASGGGGGGAYLASGSWLKLSNNINSRVAQIQWELLLAQWDLMGSVIEPLIGNLKLRFWLAMFGP